MGIRILQHVALLTLAVSVLALSTSAQETSGPPPIGDMSIGRAQVRLLAELPDEASTCLAFSPDSSTLVCGTEAGRVLSLNLADGSILREFASHAGAVTSVSFSPDGLWLASSGEDGWVQVAHLDDAERSFSLGHAGAVYEVEFSPQGTYLGTVGEERRVRLWDTTTWEEMNSLRGHTDTVYAMAFSPAEDLVVTGAGGSDPSIRLWDMSTGAELRSDLFEGMVLDIEYSPRSRDRHASIAGTQRMIRLWEVDRGAMLHNVGRFQGAVRDVAYSSAGNTLVAVSEDCTLFFTTMPAWTEKRRISFDEPLWAVAFSNSRQYIACSDAAGNVYLLSIPE